ncbi:hypothetical protein [Bradyrhizobium sp. Gha]|uniref:hypothetical protein n=1 Tax=Bradyrhizobium sp. Gha TaxID=1855318 RepID=UPI001FCDFC3F|nr:hypothetical protein [Bradyrhizobium sp. Gha]
MVDWVTLSRDHCVLIERNRLQRGRQQIEVSRRQRCQKAVTDCADARHFEWPAALYPSSSFRVLRTGGGLSMRLASRGKR